MPIIRVMTFNVCSIDPADFPADVDPQELDDGWGRRAGLNVACIKRHRPDLIGLQELNREKYETYRHELPEYACAAPEGEAWEVPAIFWRVGALDLVERGTFYLSRTPEVRSADWGVASPLAVAWARLRLREGGGEVLHLNTQFEDGPEGEQSRLEGSRLVARRGAELQRRGEGHPPLLLTGDFNCNPWSAPYQVFMGAGFTDTYRAAGHGDSATSSTFHGFQGEGYFALDWGGELFWRVDWILLREGDAALRTTSCTIVREAAPPLYPSDHYPVVAEVLVGVPRPA